MCSRRVCLFLLIALWTIPARAQLTARVELVDGTASEGLLQAGNLERVLIGKSAREATSHPTAKILRLVFPVASKTRLPPLSNSAWIALASGERLRVAPVVMTDESLTAEWHHFKLIKPITLPLESCRGLALEMPADPFEIGHTWRRLLRHEANSDVVQLRNGDRVIGELQGLEDGKLKTTTTLGEVSSELGAVSWLAFNPALVSSPKLGETFAEITLIDGTLLRVGDLTIERESLVAKSVAGFRCEFPVSVVRDIKFIGSTLRLLADLKAPQVSTSTTPGITRSPATNMNVLSGPLVISGMPFSSGFGVLSGTTLSWKLDARYRAFQCWVGVDDAAESGGSVVFEVLADGRSLWKSERLEGSQPAVRTPLLELNGKQELTLIVHSADRGQVLDFADWCDAVLVTKEP